MSKLVVKSVNPDSAGQHAGIQQGDTILEVYDIPVESRAQLVEVMTAESQKHDSLSILVHRGGNTLRLNHSKPSDSSGCIVKEEIEGASETQSKADNGRLYILGVVGILTLVAGLYFLLIVPEETINLHRLTIGQTLALIGAFFIAVEWRPKGQTHTTE